MKWSDEQVSKLKELCYAGKNNKEIAQVLDCNVNDVYNKRSQLGITIAKCKGIEVNQAFEKALLKRMLDPDVREAFEKLHSALILKMAHNYTPLAEAEIYADVAEIILSLQDMLSITLGGN